MIFPGHRVLLKLRHPSQTILRCTIRDSNQKFVVRTASEQATTVMSILLAYQNLSSKDFQLLMEEAQAIVGERVLGE